MKPVFISYKREDEPLRDKLIKVINAPYYAWYDKKDIQGAWKDEIENALRRSYACVVIVTNEIFKSDWVLFEVAFARGFGLDVIPWFAETITDDNRRKELYKLLSSLHGVVDGSPGKLPEIIDRVLDSNLSHRIDRLIAHKTLRLRVLIYIMSAYLAKEKTINKAQIWYKKVFDEFDTVSQFWDLLVLQQYPSLSNYQKRICKELMACFDELAVSIQSIQMQITYNRDVDDEVFQANRILLDKLAFIDAYIQDNLEIGEPFRFPKLDSRSFYNNFLVYLPHLDNDAVLKTNHFFNIFMDGILTAEEKELVPIFYRASMFLQIS